MEKFKDFLKRKLKKSHRKALKLENDDDEDYEDEEEYPEEDYDGEDGEYEAQDPDGMTFSIDGKETYVNRNTPLDNPDLQWKIIAQGLDNVKYINNPILDLQKYVIKSRPDLIRDINNLSPILRRKYKNELENSEGIEL